MLIQEADQIQWANQSVNLCVGWLHRSVELTSDDFGVIYIKKFQLLRQNFAIPKESKIEQ